MSAFALFNLQFTATLIVFTLIAVWYIEPRLRAQPVPAAIVPLLLVHAFRYTPLTLLVPGQVESAVPETAAQSIAYGDLLSGVLALIAVLMLRYSVPGNRIAVWVFSVIGLLDIGMAIYVGISTQLYQYELGFNWYILNYYVPVLCVTHIMIIRHLLRNRTRK